MKNSIRQAVKKFVLRGPLLDAWVRRKSHRLEHEFIRRFLKTPKSSQPPTALLPSTPRPAPRTIAFIADCMWELDNLVPELERIADVNVLDLRSILRQAGT